MTPQRPPFREAFFFWLKLGFISFGGPAGQIAILREFLVEKKRWISDAKFLHALNFCMLLPGPEAQQLATYTGWLLHGVKGGLAAGILFVLPSVFILWALSAAYAAFGQIFWVESLFYGLKPAVVAIVGLALFKIAKKSLRSQSHWAAAALSFIALFVFNVPFPAVIVAALLAGFFLSRVSSGAGTGAQTREEGNEEAFYLTTRSTVAGSGFSLRRFQGQCILWIVLWAAPFIFLYLLGSDFRFWKTLVFFFTKAAFVTFGGAYAVLPYVSQVSVENLHWLSRGEMIDGLALGESTPGPLIMVLAFVGYMAGFHHFGGSHFSGALGLFTTTFYTFLPSLMFIFIGAPVVEKTQANPRIKTVLSVVAAAVVGVVLNLAVYFGRTVVLPPGGMDYFSLAWIAVSLIAMGRFKVGMISWIAVSALAGFALRIALP